MDVDIAERLIEYKKKISEQWMEKTATPSQSRVDDDIASENDTDSEDEKEKVRKLLTFKKKM
jgi:hypothetical protein